MPSHELLIFDLDDTLLDTSDLYYQCRQEFIDFLKPRCQVSELVHVFEESDAQNIVRFGYAPWRYAYTMTEIYLALTRESCLRFNADDLIRVINIAKRIEIIAPELRPGAKEMLSVLSKNYKLAILTRGDQHLQQRKLQHHNLNHFFEYISIVDKKTPESFINVLDATVTNPEMAWSIGDSPKWDIIPAQEAHLRTILVNYKHLEYEWAHEERKSESLSDTFTINDLREIPTLLAKFSVPNVSYISATSYITSD